VLSRYTPALLSLLFAFVLGSAYMLWVGLLQSAVRTAFRIWTWIFPWNQLLDRWLVYVNNSHVRQRQQPAGQTPKRSSVSLHFRFVQWLAARRGMRDDLRDRVVSAWTTTASTLLKRYGIDYRQRYDPWTQVLGHLTIEDLRGFTLGTTLHATGWAGLSAIYFAPALNATPFKALCVLFIFGGLMQALRLAQDSEHSMRSWIVGLANTWAELKEAPPPRAENKPEA
jgi:hypothetical protein